MFKEMILLLSVLLLLLYYYIKRIYSYWESKGVESVPAIFPFGSLKDPILCRKTVGKTFWDLYR